MGQISVEKTVQILICVSPWNQTNSTINGPILNETM